MTMIELDRRDESQPLEAPNFARKVRAIPRILVAGVGNLFFGDDAFGIEVARRLLDVPLPDTRVADFGIRMIHLAYELLEPLELLIVADCISRGGPPGALYVLDPEIHGHPDNAAGNGHGMDLARVFSAARELGGTPPKTFIVGCEPEVLEPGIGLSENVARAIPDAIELIRDLVASTREIRQ